MNLKKNNVSGVYSHFVMNQGYVMSVGLLIPLTTIIIDIFK